jgi:hypothetical protein
MSQWVARCTARSCKFKISATTEANAKEEGQRHLDATTKTPAGQHEVLVYPVYPPPVSRRTLSERRRPLPRRSPRR